MTDLCWFEVGSVTRLMLQGQRNGYKTNTSGPKMTYWILYIT